MVMPLDVCAVRVLTATGAALCLPKTLPVVTARTPDGALPLLQSAEDSETAVPSLAPRQSVAARLVARQSLIAWMIGMLP
jgi:hypothetical protein